MEEDAIIKRTSEYMRLYDGEREELTEENN